MQGLNKIFLELKQTNDIDQGREKALNDLDKAYRMYVEISRNISDGKNFYQDIEKVLVQYVSNAKVFTVSRAREKEEMANALMIGFDQMNLNADSFPVHMKGYTQSQANNYTVAQPQSLYGSGISEAGNYRGSSIQSSQYGMIPNNQNYIPPQSQVSFGTMPIGFTPNQNIQAATQGYYQSNGQPGTHIGVYNPAPDIQSAPNNLQKPANYTGLYNQVPNIQVYNGNSQVPAPAIPAQVSQYGVYQPSIHKQTGSQKE